MNEIILQGHERTGRGRPTIADLAAAAGVSVATVDRVLNRRHPVREATAQRVLEAAETLGYHATSLLRSRLREQRRSCRMGFLLQRESSLFYQQLARHLEQAVHTVAGPTSRASIEFVDELDADVIVGRMQTIGRRVDALAVVSVDHPRVSEEIERLHDRGVPVFTLLSDLGASVRAGYVGLDARKAGRTAAWAITRLARRAGSVAIFVGSHRYLDHDTREISLRSYLREHAPEFQLLEPVVDQEQPAVAYDAALTLLRRHPELAGIYCAGAGTDGIVRALVEQKKSSEVVLVCNELTPGVRSALIDRVVDLVIATPTTTLAERTVQAILDAIERPSTFAPVQIMLPFQIHGPENI